jgi:coiled-coil domain-containing protein 34
LEQEEREKIEEAHREVMEERKMQAEAKVQEWMEKKKIEAEKKMARINEMKKNLEVIKEKPKEFKKAINFQQWINQKNESLMTAKKRQEEKKKDSANYRKYRDISSSQSYDKWVRSASAKPKPVPIGKGLDSLRGSSTRIYVNPEPWSDDWD